MTRTEPRVRREVSARTIRVLKMLGFRYSIGRNAYVLRVIGNRVGPVYRERERPPAGRTEQKGGRRESKANAV